MREKKENTGKRGQVILVGAGPGDVGLLTLKGKSALEKADVVVYDRLVSGEILSLIPSDTRTINVGKSSCHHLVPQEEINQILLEEALSGNCVVRLKGGDPFLFGRGGEELELLVKHQVPFQEVPGIPSAIAVPAYGGIPVTHRDCTSSLHIITGHPQKGKTLDIPFQALVETKGTLVFLMGVSSLGQICQGLLQAKMSPDMPVAVIEKGTTPQQRRLSSTLSTLETDATTQGIVSPSVIVVGHVCGLEGLDWFSDLPLFGVSVVVTRPKERAGTLSGKLRELGAEVMEYPCIETTALTPNPSLELALQQLDSYEWVVLSSPVGVEVFWNALRAKGKDARHLSQLKFAVVGPSTSKALESCGIVADLMPKQYSSEGLGEELANLEKEITGKVLILTPQEHPSSLGDILNKHGISLEEVAIYTTHYENPQSQRLKEQLISQEIWVTFTSASTVKGFVSSVGVETDFSNVKGLCIGQQTAHEAEKWGISTDIAEKSTMESMVDCLCHVVEQRREST